MYEIAQLKVYTLLRLLLMVEKVLPMIGPRIMRAAITTMATKTRIRAYSTKPWPFSFGANNILVDSPFVRIVLKTSGLIPIIAAPTELTRNFPYTYVSLTILQIGQRMLNN